MTNQQSLSLLQNNLQGETLVAPFDGIVRSVNAQLSNKVNAGSLICQISPLQADGLKIQLFSSSEIPLGTPALFYDNNNTFLGSGLIAYQLPYQYSLTQNYIYELTNPVFAIGEGQQLQVRFQQQPDTTSIRIPLSYVTPKLQGYFVSVQQ